jgi:hypothetical protein
MIFFFKFDETYKQLSCHNIFISSCQCECDISKIINFCFIWIAHEFWFNNERINSIKLSMILSSYVASCFWICFLANISLIDWKIDALFNIIIFHSSMITSDAHFWESKKSFANLFFSLLLSLSIVVRISFTQIRNSFEFDCKDCRNRVKIWRLFSIFFSVVIIWSDRRNKSSAEFLLSKR